MSATQGDILAELKRIGDLLLQLLDQETAWTEEARQRNEKWEAGRGERENEIVRIKQEKLDFLKRSIQEAAEQHAKERQEDIVRMRRLNEKYDRYMAAHLLARGELDRAKEEEA